MDTPNQTPNPASGELKPIRTYQGDVEEILKKENVSLSTIAIAEQNKEPEREAPVLFTQQPEKPKVLHVETPLQERGGFHRTQVNWKRLGLLLAAGAGIGLLMWGGFVFITRERPPETEPVRLPLPKDDTPVGAVSFSGTETRTAVQKAIRDRAKSVVLPLNETGVFPVTHSGAPMDPLNFLSLLRSSASGTLIRALGNEMVFGVHNFQGNQLFLVIPVLSFDHAFDGMIAWEKQLLQDVGPLFGIKPEDLQMASASTTAELLQRRIAIKDVIIKNKDARAAFDTEGKIVFLYAFPDKQTLIMTSNEETFKILLNKTGGGILK